jgi:hypothetical protein
VPTLHKPKGGATVVFLTHGPENGKCKIRGLPAPDGNILRTLVPASRGVSETRDASAMSHKSPLESKGDGCQVVGLYDFHRLVESTK